MAGDPGTELNLGRRAREASACLARSEDALDSTVDGPLDAVGGPVDGVLVELARNCVHRRRPAELVVGLITLGEDIGLDHLVFGADGLPVNLVEVVGEEHNGADDAWSGAACILTSTRPKKMYSLERGVGV